MDQENETRASQTAIKLLTLLNVAAARPSPLKRKADLLFERRDWNQIARKAVRLGGNRDGKGKEGVSRVEAVGGRVGEEVVPVEGEIGATDEEEDVVDDDGEAQEVTGQSTSWKNHWSSAPPVLTPSALTSAEKGEWEQRKTTEAEGLGNILETRLKGSDEGDKRSSGRFGLNTKLLEKFGAHMKRTKPSLQANGMTALQTNFLQTVSNHYQDVFHSNLKLDQHPEIRAALALHAMDHVVKTRSRILRNNEHLARQAALQKEDPSSTLTNNEDAAERDLLDQSFTRPRILILLPFRNSAVKWVDMFGEIQQGDMLDGRQRFEREFGLPEGTRDRLAEDDEAEMRGDEARYPREHRETFKGNIDDTFRLGMKVTRKSLKLYSDFYSSDILIASPLGLRTTIEEGDESAADFLSSIEILVIDQADIMLMQNWEHFVMKHLNKIPKEPHGCDFSRVKPWYLDGKAANLRQTIILSSYPTPELRSLFNRSLVNVEGKVQIEGRHEGVLSTVRRGIKQVFARFETKDVWEEEEKRSEEFTTKTLPTVLKSAVSSTNTLIFVPSYFDFVRLKSYLGTLPDLSVAYLSEYSSNSEISRARNQFFTGRKSFLVVTERFHFFRRYRIRGARTLIFYAPPDHPQYYSEFLSYPFLRGDKERIQGQGQTELEDMMEPLVDESEVSVQVLFSKFDLLRLERIVGSKDARKMVGSEEGSRFTFM